MTAPKPNPPRFDSDAVRRRARDILIRVRIIELYKLAERTARGEVPAPDDDPPQQGDQQ
jgi:hypothetical protein